MRPSVMAAASEFFEILLTTNFSEGGNDEIVAKEIKGTCLKMIIDFCHTGHIALNEENVSDIAAAAASMELTLLERKCYQYLELRCSDDSLLLSLKSADKCDIKNLHKKHMSRSREYFEEVPALTCGFHQPLNVCSKPSMRGKTACNIMCAFKSTMSSSVLELRTFDFQSSSWTDFKTITSPVVSRCVYQRGNFILFEKENNRFSRVSYQRNDPMYELAA